MVLSELPSSEYNPFYQTYIMALGNVELLDPEIPGSNKYQAGGVKAPNGCVYFAPERAGKVLCINAEGIVEFLILGVLTWGQLKINRP